MGRIHDKRAKFKREADEAPTETRQTTRDPELEELLDQVDEMLEEVDEVLTEADQNRRSRYAAMLKGWASRQPRLDSRWRDDPCAAYRAERDYYLQRGYRPLMPGEIPTGEVVELPPCIGC